MVLTFVSVFPSAASSVALVLNPDAGYHANRGSFLESNPSEVGDYPCPAACSADELWI